MCGTNLKQFYKKVKFHPPCPIQKRGLLNVVITELTLAAKKELYDI